MKFDPCMSMLVLKSSCCSFSFTSACHKAVKSHLWTFPTPSSDFIDLNFRENCLGLKCKHLIGFSLTELLGLLTCVRWKKFCSVELDADIRYRWSSNLHWNSAAGNADKNWRLEIDSWKSAKAWSTISSCFIENLHLHEPQRLIGRL
jgi:hypothetical protein